MPRNHEISFAYYANIAREAYVLAVYAKPYSKNIYNKALDIAKEAEFRSLNRLGNGLHSLQDLYAHGGKEYVYPFSKHFPGLWPVNPDDGRLPHLIRLCLLVWPSQPRPLWLFIALVSGYYLSMFPKKVSTREPSEVIKDMRFSQGWSILLGAALAAFLYDAAILLEVRLVPGGKLAVVAAFLTAFAAGVVAAVMASILANYRARGAALGAALLAPFFTLATGVGKVFLAGLPDLLANYLFFSGTFAATLAGAGAVIFARRDRPRRRSHLRRVK
ncbi:MAG: hypothetical protein M1548_03555 [Actinobacteria bacterium]|nr:hypothetical protein [Actinomycetota bacterium]